MLRFLEHLLDAYFDWMFKEPIQNWRLLVGMTVIILMLVFCISSLLMLIPAS